MASMDPIAPVNQPSTLVGTNPTSSIDEKQDDNGISEARVTGATLETKNLESTPGASSVSAIQAQEPIPMSRTRFVLIFIGLLVSVFLFAVSSQSCTDFDVIVDPFDNFHVFYSTA